MTLEVILQQVKSVCAQLELVLIWEGLTMLIRLRLTVAKAIFLIVRSINYDDPCRRIGTVWCILGSRGDKSNVVKRY